MKTSTIRVTDQYGAPLAHYYVLVRREGSGDEEAFAVQLDENGAAELESGDGEAFEVALPDETETYAYVASVTPDYSLN